MLDQSQAELRAQQLNLQQQLERHQVTQSEATRQLSARQKDLDALREELQEQKNSLGQERKELATLRQAMNSDREQAAAELQEQRAALAETRRQIESLQAGLTQERESIGRARADLESERKRLAEERAIADSTRQEIEQRQQEWAKEVVHAIMRWRPGSRNFNGRSKRSTRNAVNSPRPTAISMRNCSVSKNRPTWCVLIAKSSLRNAGRSNTERERLEEFALEQTEQFAHLERQRDAESEVVLAAPEVEEVIEMPGYREPVMGEQFEHVDPVLLGEPKQKQSAASAASTVAEEKRIAPERVPVDPAADEAYEELVDRLVQFNYSKKKRWFKFW